MNFTDAQFLTAAQKARTFGAWERFVRAIAEGKTGTELFRFFTDNIYKHLSLHCSFIAHYNRRGFFEMYFDEPEDTVRFFTQFDPDGLKITVEMGTQYWYNDAAYHDLNAAMCEATRPYLAQINTVAIQQQKRIDLARANTLLTKHGMPTVSPTQGGSTR